MNLGLLGGSFDPIHVGHLRAAENARESLGLQEVLFVPARQSPHKGTTSAGANDRLAMTRLATANHPQFSVSDMELRRPAPSYTVDTLTELHAQRPQDRLFLIVGSDTLPDLASWHAAPRLFELCTLAVVTRPGEPTPSAGALAGARVMLADGPGLAVSSSEVRRRLRSGLGVRYLVPDGVVDYLARHGLYR
jgi:nicotinate-nucleotide adenylyltransferase